MQPVTVGTFTIGKGQPLTLISGPCIIESRDHAMECAERLINIVKNKNINLIFKASYDKANRSSYHSFRGPGIDQGLAILQEIKVRFAVPVLSDIHLPEEVQPASEVLDVLQIPAFLCRQTDLVFQAAKTGKPLHIKKGQFMAPWDMKHVVGKLEAGGGRIGQDQFWQTEQTEASPQWVDVMQDAPALQSLEERQAPPSGEPIGPSQTLGPVPKFRPAILAPQRRERNLGSSWRSSRSGWPHAGTALSCRRSSRRSAESGRACD